jgi:hypothetical protein
LKIIGHHACGKEGGHDVVLDKSPFPSKEDKKKGYFPFLSEGFYFWDNNISLAHVWGKAHYQDNYYILEAELELTSDVLFDLVGNRSHMILFMELHKIFENEYNSGDRWPMGKFIEFLRDLNNESETYKGIFPFLAARAIDLSRTKLEQFKFLFVDSKDNYTNLSPCLVICLYEKNNVILQSKILINQN